MSDDADEREAAGTEAEAEVSRLLAAARHDEPAPPDVVARIEAALAAEAATTPEATTTPGAERSPAPVADLAARRRGRLRTGLLAAAVVVVAGVGVGAVVQEGLGGDDGSADSSAGSSGAEAPAPSSQQPPGALDQDEAAPEGPDVMGARAPLPRVRTGPTLADDVARALRTGASLPATRARCGPAGPADDVVRVLADGSRAELLVGPAEDAERVVSLHPCGGPDEDPLATVVVPAP